jgi:hypothetical protein
MKRPVKINEKMRSWSRSVTHAEEFAWLESRGWASGDNRLENSSRLAG